MQIRYCSLKFTKGLHSGNIATDHIEFSSETKNPSNLYIFYSLDTKLIAFWSVSISDVVVWVVYLTDNETRYYLCIDKASQQDCNHRKSLAKVEQKNQTSEVYGHC